MRIAFLFNHDQIHQVAHSLPVALALAEKDLDAEIIVATTNPRVSQEVDRLCRNVAGKRLQRVELSLASRRSRVLARTFEALLPASKLLVYGDNLDFFRSLDVLVVAEQTSLLLKTHYGLKDLVIIYTGHGAGDRAIGFHSAIAGFDHVLVSGPKLRDRLIRDARVQPERISVVGYPKFDLAPPTPARDSSGFGQRPVVLYNPHVSPHLSSWYRQGRSVLDWFVEHVEYELIFAPHVMLFERPFVLTIDRLRLDRAGAIAHKHLDAPNIHIDLGSRRSTTMDYTTQADIYLGDASSQVYEFLLRPRPCVFLNSHRAAWRDDVNYTHWRNGPVIEEVSELEGALQRARSEHGTVYRPIQTALFNATFELTQEPSSRRAARAVAACAGLGWPADTKPAVVHQKDRAWA